MAAENEESRRQKAVDETKSSLVRMQSFDPMTLPREQDLGTQINFKDAVAPARRLIGLYNQLSVDVLESLPQSRLQQIKSQADSDFNRLQEALNFQAGTPKSTRDSLVQSLAQAYDPAFERLAETISYSIRKSTDFERLERDGRASIQAVVDEAAKAKAELDRAKQEAAVTLDAVKKVAAEQGVSQQAIYFKTEADDHGKAAENWLKATILMTFVLAVYAAMTLMIHKWEWLKPANTFETIQLSVSKVLVFATISFFLALCAKNYLAHRHNTVVNRHRQNALTTYTAIVKAANAGTNSDIVLNKAADCIFSPQSTAYARADGGESGTLSVLSVGPNSVKPSLGGSSS